MGGGAEARVSPDHAASGVVRIGRGCVEGQGLGFHLIMLHLGVGIGEKGEAGWGVSHQLLLRLGGGNTREGGG